MADNLISKCTDDQLRTVREHYHRERTARSGQGYDVSGFTNVINNINAELARRTKES